MGLLLKKAEQDFFKCERYGVFLNKIKDMCPNTEIIIDIDSIKGLTGEAMLGAEKKPVPVVLFGFLKGYFWTALQSGFHHITTHPLGKEAVLTLMKKLTFRFAQDNSLSSNNYQLLPEKGPAPDHWVIKCAYNWTLLTDVDAANGTPVQGFDKVFNKLLPMKGTTLQIAKAEADYQTCDNFKNFLNKMKTYCPTQIIVDDESVKNLKGDVNWDGPYPEPISFCVFKMYAGYYWMCIDAAFFRCCQDALVKETIASDIAKLTIRVKQEDSITMRHSYKWLLEKGTDKHWTLTCIYNWKLLGNGDATNTPTSDIQAQLMNLL